MGVDPGGHLLFFHSILHGFDQTRIQRQAAGHHHHALFRDISVDGFEQFEQAVRHGFVDAAQNIAGRNRAGHHVDDIGFREHGADAADLFGIVG